MNIGIRIWRNTVWCM